jgi:D-beta-D-heptose 7-phosphate kinase/D-beta-D-heptose 1-phosphate adenosyltransferase
VYRHLSQWVEKWTGAHVVVVGDLALDRYVWGAVERISAEAPVPVVQVRREETRLGAAGAVVAMAHALGLRVTYAGVVGDDAAGQQLREHLAELGLSDSAVLTDSTLPTTEKTRIIAKVQQVCRVDKDPAGPVTEGVRSALRQRVASALEEAAVLCLEDYNKGLFSPELLQELIALARAKGVPVLLDPWRHGDFSRYRGASLICPNRMEASGAVHRQLDTEADLEAAAEQLLRELELEAVLITLGGDGSALLERGGQLRHLPAKPRAVFDPTGAGDMTLAALGAAVAAGAPYFEAAQLANVASGLKVEKLGTAVVTREELLADLAGLNLSTRAKVLPRDRLAAVLAESRRRGETVVFTNGCFDLLHPGHLELLRVASLQGDVLVVALNADASVRGLKGPGRPLLGEEARAEMLAALEMVDYVTLFSEPTPLATIQLLKPDVLVKGEDWRDKGVVGREFVESYGGRVVLVPLAPGYSTTDILKQMRQAKDPKR